MATLLSVPVMANPVEPLKTWLDDTYALEFNGFLEARTGWRLQNDPHQDDDTINEARLQVDFTKDAEWGLFRFKGDLVGDLTDEAVRGELREFNGLFYPTGNMDLKVGRQILTWGTGDLLFINDLFPKDWESFFIGRDDEYLKSPSDALSAALFLDLINIQLVYTPQFNPSTYIDGSRISYWNGFLGETAGQNFIFEDEERDTFGRDSEIATRLYRNIGRSEVALYGYYGFWKTPEGVRPAESLIDSRLFYPRLGVYGASVRSPLMSGIGHLETGYYDSIEDRVGDDPLVRNSEVRFLAGYEHELGPDLTGAVQYYIEWMQDYGNYERTVPNVATQKDELRHLITLRLTKLLFNQNLNLSLFAYYSPSDEDGFLRPKAQYKLTDQWAVDVGANLFWGADNHTFWGQFEKATNVYAGLRWNF